MTENLPSLLPSQHEFQMFQTIARAAQTSGLYAGVGQESKIFMVLLAARELGISPMLALNGGIWNIQGKIEISARLMNGLIRRAGHSLTVVRSDDQACTLLGKRSDGDTFECTFTIEEAARAGLASRDVWKKYTSDMLYNRCMSRLARRLFPDVIGTAYVEGEIRESIQPEKLPESPCEDVTPVQEMRAIPKPEPEVKPEAPQPPVSAPVPGARVTPEQIKELETLYAKTDKDFKDNFCLYMLEKWYANTLHEIPADKFDIAKSGMLRNIEGAK